MRTYNITVPANSRETLAINANFIRVNSWVTGGKLKIDTWASKYDGPNIDFEPLSGMTVTLDAITKNIAIENTTGTPATYSITAGQGKVDLNLVSDVMTVTERGGVLTLLNTIDETVIPGNANRRGLFIQNPSAGDYVKISVVAPDVDGTTPSLELEPGASVFLPNIGQTWIYKTDGLAFSNYYPVAVLEVV